jgi:hypothetical protein
MEISGRGPAHPRDACALLLLFSSPRLRGGLFLFLSFQYFFFIFFLFSFSFFFLVPPVGVLRPDEP